LQEQQEQQVLQRQLVQQERRPVQQRQQRLEQQQVRVQEQQLLPLFYRKQPEQQQR
jgi:hypothetical protein